ncbi:HvfC/BufC N-terminal domain-containing protein [Photobacterium toruni]|uniref:DNA-binding domain-containing protein n=1 Tax=Photobacterium toruni TaxID=1935446 RepID=A0ABU6L8E5_9GAMM|nr:DNA-binding domain-containing protein [Photobacterium toruni]MEC6832830.1 DNA-binding domain-containing protein [Photobacterium toruni]
MSSSATTPNLHQLQHQFAAALHYQAHDLTTTVVDDHFSAEQRLQLYCNNFIIGLTDVLASVYVTVNAMIGDDCFNHLARQHILNHPLPQGDVTIYGAHFSDTIATQATLVSTLPYLVDLARLEWQRDCVSRLACHDGSLPLKKLRQLEHTANDITPQHYYFHIPTSTDTFSSQYAVVSLWEIVNHPHQDQHQLLAMLDINQPQTALIQHYQWQIWQQHVTPALVTLVSDCQQQRPIAALTPTQLALLPQLLHHHLIDDICKVNSDD